MPCSSTPAGPLHARAAPTCAAVLPSAVSNGVGSRHSLISGLNHAACAPAVYASRPGSPSEPRKTRFRLVATLAGRDLNPQGPS